MTVSAHCSFAEVGDLFTLEAGRTVSVNSRSGPVKVPFLRTSNVYWDRIDLRAVDYMYLSEEEAGAKLLKRGDLLVCEGGEIGRSAIWHGQVKGMTYQNHLHRLRPKSKEIIPRFYLYYFQAAFTKLGLFEGEGNKTTIPNLSRSNLLRLKVPVMPRADQLETASLLRSVRRLIAAKQKEVACLDELFDVLLVSRMAPPPVVAQPLMAIPGQGA